ncbi:MAG TPA: oxygen-independent coproporphyrinogen III oxidase [Candidatus Limivivens merdigallinarum]|uniref:Heme chaperone HemW n=1 Tax=Candidatus Limivivens merdigallinarum TaxID=2840859 RepID=A0A9D0ZVT0_9FIRM|nr:oxygen-independent coproporphyrinogen III oxidase [Candidatus Limivivens merdigallinarum]
MKKELELYFHIPFCVRKCAYCDFLSAPASETVMEAYGKRLVEEIEGFEDAEAYQVCTAFFGGGTPSILAGSQIEAVMEAARRRFAFCENAEITLEANPDTVTAEKLEAWKRAGINRLSIGLQSADDGELERLGRIHDYAAFLKSFESARKAGFSNINIDLMSALPGQSVSDWERSLRTVIALDPEHISAYSLIVEEGTPFYQRYEGGESPILPSEEEERKMYWNTEKLLEKAGYCHYEISNYGKPGRFCLHNIGYWTRRDYAGFGLGAASLLNPVRYRNTDRLEDYLSGDFSKKEFQVLTKDNQIEETMFLGLRLLSGISIQNFQETFSCPVTAVYSQELAKMKELELMEEADGRLFLTRKGVDVSNQVMAEFLLS